MNKKYQVFVSSTYMDLQEERQAVIKTLMKMNCIPVGMELFPAADEEQLTFIERAIDDCDYYLLIIGGRYGSINSEGISFTEKEFDYAVKKSLKVIAFIHEDPEKIPLGKSEPTPELRKKLEDFKNKVRSGRLIKTWKTAQELSGEVALSMLSTIQMYPAIGWVRANQIANESLLIELNELRKENSELQKTVTELNNQQNYQLANLADIESEFTVNGNYYRSGINYISGIHSSKWKLNISWREIFSLISPYLIEHPNDELVKHHLVSSLKKRESLDGSLDIDDQDFKTITVQLKAYDLITTQYSQTIKGGMALFWALTKKGERLMMESRVVRKKSETSVLTGLRKIEVPNSF